MLKIPPKDKNNVLPYKTNWYPTLDPNVNPRSFVYLDSLRAEPSIIENTQYIQASELLRQSHKALSPKTLFQSYQALYELYIRERKAEVQFINERLKLNYDPEDVSIKDLMDAINKLLNFESTYKANIKRIIEPQGKKSQQLEYLYYTTRFTLPDEINKALDLEVIPLLKRNAYRLDDPSLYEEVTDILRSTILNVLKSQYTGKDMPDENKPYNEFMELVESLEGQDQLVSDLLTVYGVDPAQIKKKVSNDVSVFDRNEKAFLKTRGGKGLGGFAFESFVEAIGRAVVSKSNGKVLSTGSLGNMKADQIFSFNLELDIQKLADLFEMTSEDEYSRRIKNIQAMEKMFKELEGAKGDIVFVSDKSYNFVGDTFEGFTAESPSLRVVNKILDRAKINEQLIEHIIFIAANSGAGRANGNNIEDVRRFIASSIGNFMFDDTVISNELSSEGLSSVNRLHVFNLNNIYVPFSVLLKGLYDSLKRTDKDYKNIVNVGFSAMKIDYKEQKDGLTKKDWLDLYNSTLIKSKFHFHFFKNFADFIREALQ